MKNLLFVWFQETNKTAIEKQSYEVILRLENNYAKLSNNAWVILTERTIRNVRDQLEKYSGPNERLFIIDINASKWASLGIPKEMTDAIKSGQKKLVLMIDNKIQNRAKNFQSWQLRPVPGKIANRTAR